MALQVSPDVLVAIWQALNAPVPKPSKLETTWAKLAASGWITDIGFEDALLMLDRRLDAFGLKPEALAGILDLSFRAVFARPASRFDDPNRSPVSPRLRWPATTASIASEISPSDDTKCPIACCPTTGDSVASARAPGRKPTRREPLASARPRSVSNWSRCSTTSCASS